MVVRTYDLYVHVDQMDKLIDHVESMVEMCDSDEEIKFYEDWLTELKEEYEFRFKGTQRCGPTVTETQLSKIIDYVESMLEVCDSTDLKFYEDWLTEINSDIVKNNKVMGW